MTEDVKWYGAEFDREIDKIIKAKLLKIVYRLERIIQELIRQAKSGRIYKRKASTHKASAPGESPAIDTGALAKGVTHADPQNIGGAYSIDVGESAEGGRAKIAEYLEFGTSDIEARPLWRPALAQLQQEIGRELED